MSKLTEQLEIIDGIIRSLHDLKASITHEAQHKHPTPSKGVMREAQHPVATAEELTTKANMPNHTLAISRDDLIVLKRMYDAAMASNKERFEFKGQVLLTQYAKYVIEYTESGFDSTRR